jgi:hypothetical protein
MEKDKTPAIRQPEGTDPAWAEKIAQAKAAREQGKRLRAGRPSTISSRRSLSQS